MPRILIVFISILFVLPSTAIGQSMSSNPIMVVTCKRASALKQQDEGIRIIQRVNQLYTTQKLQSVKPLKNFGDPCIPGTLPCPPGFSCYEEFGFDGFCVTACDGAGNCPDGFECVMDSYTFNTYCAPIIPDCMECDEADGSFLIWSHAQEQFICADPLIQGATIGVPFLNGDCDCESGLIRIPNGDGTFNCAYPLCFDTNIASEFECDGSGQVTVTLTPLDAAGNPAVLPANAVITVDNLANCEFSDPNAAALYTAATSTGSSVALNTLVFTVTLSGPGGASLSLPDLGVTIDIPDMNCPVISIEDPCDCENPFNPDLGPAGLFQDRLSVAGLIPGQNYTLVTNNGGFYNAAGTLYPTNTVFTADATGEISQVFFRGPEESADIVLSTGNAADVDITFVSPNPCPNSVDCGLAVIPTLGQWGIINLSILLMILGVARIKSMEQDALEKVL